MDDAKKMPKAADMLSNRALTLTSIKSVGVNPDTAKRNDSAEGKFSA